MRQFDEETGQYYSRVQNQDHYTLTDGEERFLVHITKPEKKVEDSHVNDEKQMVRNLQNLVMKTFLKSKGRNRSLLKL